MEAVRAKVMQFLHASSPNEIVFTSGTTEGINLVARGIGQNLQRGDEIIVSVMEHHSNYLPWQEICRQTGAALRIIPLLSNGDLDMESYRRALTEQTKMVAICSVSNVLGTANPLTEICALAHSVGSPVLIDGAQGLRHGAIDVQAINCDFFCFSGHKLSAPTGTGVLYGKKDRLDTLPPTVWGGGMVKRAETSEWEPAPFRLEAGTPNIGGIIGLGAAIDYITGLGLETVAAYESGLLTIAENMLRQIPELTIYGSPTNRCGALSINISGIHCYDVATLLDKQGIAVRSGHHCAQPLMEWLKADGSVRISPAYYNTEEELFQLEKAIKRIVVTLKRSKLL